MRTPKKTDPRLVRLDAKDNVLILAKGVRGDESILVEEAKVTIDRPLALGHKIAARDIAKGEAVIKYGAPIGIATEPIPRGAHVHVHNVRSNYTPTYVLPEAD